jgi:toxin ParE1/3/4
LPEYRLSNLARLDLIEIADYTVDMWGLEQANRYLDGLVDCFVRITQSPELGRPCDRVRAGYRRTEFEKHVVIYRIDDDGIFVSRILHQRMLPSKHVIEDL